MASKAIAELTPRTQDLIKAFEARLAEEGLKFKRTCTYRSQPEQDALWSRGRKPYWAVVQAYKWAGLPAPSLAEASQKVTWTRTSVHTLREAVDYCIDGKTPFDLKADIDDDDIPDWQEFGEIAKECGLEWGGDWGKGDFCHVQLTTEGKET